MMLTGLPLGTLLAIFGGAAALTVVRYILRLRRRPVAVPFAPLWHSVLGDRDASRLFSRLRREPPRERRRASATPPVSPPAIAPMFPRAIAPEARASL